MGRTFYLAAKVQNNDAFEEVKNCSLELQDRGHINICKWWEMNGVAKPYLDNIDTNAPLAVKMSKAACAAQVFVLFARDDILGAAKEFGMSLATAEYDPDKRIYVVGAYTARQSIFYTHPRVENINSYTDLRNTDWY